MAGIAYRKGQASAGEFYGRDVTYYLVGNTANTVGQTGSESAGVYTEGNFDQAIRAINSVASIEMVGARTDAGFLVGITGYNGRKVSGTDVAAATHLVTVIEAATGLADVTVAAKTLAHAQFA